MGSNVRESVLRKLRDAYKIDNLAKFQEEIIYQDELYYPTLRNILFSAPTGSGKSLVAETIACVNVLLSRKRCIFIEPYIASASELFFSLQRQWRSLGLIVKAHFGAASLSLREEFDAVVCTIEKGTSLVSRLIKDRVLDQFSTIVIDEVHMTFDNDRGTLIEDLLIKLKFMNTISTETVCQVIAMSATVEDATPLEGLLNTTILDYSICEKRDLDEYYIVNNKYYSQRKEEIELVEKQPMFNFKSDETGVLNLVMESLVEWKSVLVFCRTKALVEKTAKLIAMCIDKCSKKKNDTFKVLGDRVGECNLLSGCGFMDTYIKTGVAFHHSGVPNEIRKKIETLYRERKIAVIVCTSTLSTGVNLPASRVLIILADNFDKSLNYVAYHQMIGRTGRRGFGRGSADFSLAALKSC
ncbi:unnamed protein product [Bursaphelenchus xylophilus]|uniref:(pine wood nematode) hypothetical protein n=1 Tax=Bursaphelenchus xylophilus TaxID=6326 RepID=A0A1I7ST47_BURXY|nr:unnamed protein product [Bursaphelenchus xylophilus]CAG9108737.1 unnamed protein product [Bursaphelenchus xylophilus]